MIGLVALGFVVAGVYSAGTHRFEQWAGRALEQTAPVARRVIPAPAKEILREGREHLPVYGDSGSWLARKTASIFYFGIVGLFVVVLRKQRPRFFRQTLMLTTIAAVAMSAIVEVFEWPEAIESELFDLACGAAGGLLAGLAAWCWLRRLQPIV